MTDLKLTLSPAAFELDGLLTTRRYAAPAVDADAARELIDAGLARTFLDGREEWLERDDDVVTAAPRGTAGHTLDVLVNGAVVGIAHRLTSGTWSRAVRYPSGSDVSLPFYAGDTLEVAVADVVRASRLVGAFA